MNNEDRYNKNNPLIEELILELNISFHLHTVFLKKQKNQKRKWLRQRYNQNTSVYEYIYKLRRNLQEKVK